MLVMDGVDACKLFFNLVTENERKTTLVIFAVLRQKIKLLVKSKYQIYKCSQRRPGKCDERM
jgi:hypothetical protein